MEGPEQVSGPEDPNAGMIPRAVQQIYSACESLKEKGWEYNMQAQFLEIYNETLRDLLDNGNETKKLDIKHDSKNRTTVSDAINGI
jgi:kinesin family protein C1